MTNYYFERHAESEYNQNTHDRDRTLSINGKIQSEKITEMFESIDVDHVISSPFKRAIETVQGVSAYKNLHIITIENLRERAVTNGHIKNFDEYAKKQWEDHNYKLAGGESLNETKERVLKVLKELELDYCDKTIVIGTHGTFLAILINHFNSDFGYVQWKEMQMPEVYKLVMEKGQLIDIEKMEL